MNPFITNDAFTIVMILSAALVATFVIYSTNYITITSDGNKGLFGLNIGSESLSKTLSHVSYWSILALEVVLIVNFFLDRSQTSDLLSPIIGLAVTLMTGGYFMNSIIGNKSSSSRERDNRKYVSILFFGLGSAAALAWTSYKA